MCEYLEKQECGNRNTFWNCDCGDGCIDIEIDVKNTDLTNTNFTHAFPSEGVAGKDLTGCVFDVVPKWLDFSGCNLTDTTFVHYKGGPKDLFLSDQFKGALLNNIRIDYEYIDTDLESVKIAKYIVSREKLQQGIYEYHIEFDDYGVEIVETCQLDYELVAEIAIAAKEIRKANSKTSFVKRLFKWLGFEV